MARCKKGDLVIIERGDPTRVKWTCLCQINRMFNITERGYDDAYPHLLYWKTPTVWHCLHNSVAMILDEVCRPIRPSPTNVDIDVGKPEVLTL